MMAKMGDQKAIIEQINNKKKSKVKNGAANSDKKSIAEFFREQINKKNWATRVWYGWFWPQ